MGEPTPRAEPFRVDVPESEVADLRARLRAARWVGDPGNEDWRYGTNERALADLCRTWAEDFDWRTQEAAINRLPQFRVVLDGIPIHFVHVRGVGAPDGPPPMPIVLTHGWPWTFWDYHRVIGPLSDPASHGGDPADAFDVVVPSLPGFAWSTPLTVTGVNCQRAADLWARLMTEVLGYERFAAGGGDWGGIVTANLAHAHADTVIGVHLTLQAFVDLDYAALGPDDFEPDEADRWARHASFLNASHMAVHCTDPQSLAYGLNDSPIGLAAWMLERRRAWSDCDGDVESVFARDFLLTTFSIYWFTRSIGTSMRWYYENFAVPWVRRHDRRPAMEAPTAIAVFPRDVVQVPRRWAERHANLERWTVMPHGGHFAPSEEPDALVDDVRAFFRPYRSVRTPTRSA
jgi:pimeloyl-ACP methyl ester carboxylesterase